jgi:uncharacterized repeat protein (TIGR01451 family)
VEVSRDADSPFIPVFFLDGMGRVPQAVPDIDALRRLRVKVQGADSGRVFLQPEADFALAPSEERGLIRIAATYWGDSGNLLVSAADARGEPLEAVSEEGRRMSPGADKWLDFGPMSRGEKAALLVFPMPSSVWPITVRFLSQAGEVQELSFNGSADQAQNRQEATGVCATPGQDGNAGTLTGIINTYYPVTATVSAGGTLVSVGAATGAATAIASGDLLILIQMQDAQINGDNTDLYGDGVSGGNASGYTALNNAGRYEYVVATGPVSGGSVPIRGAGAGNGTLNTYTVAASSATKGRSSAQLVRVPQYLTATLSSTLTCKAWDGSTGGILALDVSARLTLNGTTSVSGKGFRGGVQQQLDGQTTPAVAMTDYRILGPADGATTTGTGGMKGEGIAGTPRLMPNANNGAGLDGYLNGDWYRGGPGNAGGGGNDSDPATNNENAGGAGGGNGGIGGGGGASWSGNQPIGGYPGAVVTASGGVAVLGGGGGAGARNNLANGGDGGGGAGGGIVLIRTLTVSGTGAITANGADAPGVTNPSLSDAAGGGGAGGTVIIYAKTGGLSGLSVTAQGGRGGDAWPAQAPGAWPGEHHGPGGGGGGGSILLSSAPGIASVNGGMNGISCTDNDAYGSTPGSLGTISTTLAEAAPPGADPGYLCATPANYITKASSAGTGYVGPGQTITYTINVTNTTTTAWTGVAVNDPLPANTSFVAASTQVTKVTYPTGNYADSFAAQNYTGSTGSLTWLATTPWTEIGEADGVNAGNVRVVANPFGGADNSVSINNTTARGLYRALNLSTYSNAALSFRYRRYQMTQNDTMTVQVSTNGGGAWTTLKTIKGYYYTTGNTSITDPAFLTEYYDLTPYISANFRLRFFPGATFVNTIYFDDINITVATTTVVSPIGGSPPTLVSGQTLLPGESMTVTFQVTVNDPLDPAVTSIDNTATVTADGGISQPASVSNPIIPPPVVNSPIYTMDTSISGTSTAAVGSTITVFRNGTSIGTTTVLAGGTWTLTGVSGLVAGDNITARASANGATSALSNTVPVLATPYISKRSSAGNGYASPGQTLTYTIQVTNTTGATWNNLSVTDPLTNLTYVGGSSQVTAPTDQTGTYLDQFTLPATPANPASYQGSYGTLTWPSATPWTEIDDDGSAVGGDVLVVTDGALGNALRLDDDGGAGNGCGVRRAADLSAWDAATVTFSYRRTSGIATNENVQLQISNDGGTSFPQMLATIPGTAANETTYSLSGPHTVPAAYRVSGFQLRFFTSNNLDEGDNFFADNVLISLSRRRVTTGPAGAPPNLISGYTLLAGESLTLTFQATVDPNLPNTVTAIVNTASLSANGGAITQNGSVSNPVLPAPVVSGPIYTVSTSISGTCAAPVGSTITVYQNGTPIGTTTVLAGNTWTLTGVSGLVVGDSITAMASNGGATSALSNAVIVAAWVDSDGDGIPNSVDIDDDNDGILDTVEGSGAVDTDGDGVPDSLDLDTDNDGINDLVESGLNFTELAALDADGDGRIDSTVAVGANGLADGIEAGAPDSGSPDYDNNGTGPDAVANTDGTGPGDWRDLDSDNDGINDVIEGGETDADGNGLIDGTPNPVTGQVPGSDNAVPNTDGTGLPDYRDLDSDGDGTNDIDESGQGYLDADDDGDMDDTTDTDGDGIPDVADGNDGAFGDAKDSDNDGIPDATDIDDDNDGILDTVEGPPGTDTDGDGVPDALDLDSDNDGINDLVESGLNFTELAALDANGDGRIDSTVAVGVNGLADGIESGAPDSGDPDYDNDLSGPDAVADTDGDGRPDFRDLDSDNDGINDVIEGGGTDTDGNGLIDGTPNGATGQIPGSDNAVPNTDGTGLPDYRDLDSDGDGTNDIDESGQGYLDGDDDGDIDDATDADGDGIPDVADGNDGVFGDAKDSDNDGIPDATDIDDDNDGILDTVEGPPGIDTDGDGVPDTLDLDTDNDGINDLGESGLNAAEVALADTDGDGRIDTPVGANGLADLVESAPESGNPDYDNNGTGPDAVANTDGTGPGDWRDLDSDNDGINDVIEGGETDADSNGMIDGTPNPMTGQVPGADNIVPDTDSDGTADYRDLDSDGDGTNDIDESGQGYLDGDNDGDIDNTTDGDGDGIPDVGDGAPAVFGDAKDSDNDGIPDSTDLDDDNDGINDLVESGLNAAEIALADTDGDGRIDTPVGSNGLADLIESAPGSGLPDYDNNGSGPDAVADTDGDGTPDFRDLDSDNDGINDVIEGGELDADGNGMIDGTPNPVTGQVPGSDNAVPNTDGTGLPDYRDLDSDGDGTSDIDESGQGYLDGDNDGDIDDTTDGDGDGIPDVADGNDGVFGDAKDSDNDGIPDATDIDDDNDGILDTVEGPPGTDTDGDGVPDSLDLDSDNDGINDLVESGLNSAELNALDADGDGRIDYTVPVGANGLADAIETAPDSGLPDYDNNGSGPDPVADTDGDGVPNFRDLDSDNDGITDVIEGGGTDADGNGRIDGIPNPYTGQVPGADNAVPDTDGDGAPDYLDLDSDNDGINDLVESGLNSTELNALDADGDGRIDNTAPVGTNGLADAIETAPDSGSPDYDNSGSGPDAVADTDGDGRYDFRDLDSDNDGINDVLEGGEIDANGDGLIDGAPNPVTGQVPGADNVVPDADGDGTADYRDLDSDADGIPDIEEAGKDALDADHDGDVDDATDLDGDGIPNVLDGSPTWKDSPVPNLPNLLRNDDRTNLSFVGMTAVFSKTYPLAPGDTSLQGRGTNLNPDELEAGMLSLPGSGDDDDHYLRKVVSPMTDAADIAVVGDNGRPLVFYELTCDTCTIYLTQTPGGRVQITW